MAEAENGRFNVRNLLGLLGLCARAGGLIYGTERVCEALRNGEQGKVPLLVIEASSNSANTHKRLSDKCTFYKVRHEVIPADAATLAASLGKTGELAAVGIVRSDFLRAAEKQLGALSEAGRT